jgi:hypothetical protein
MVSFVRNWERNLSSFDAGGADDIDLLVDNYQLSREVLGAIPVFAGFLCF